MAINRRGHHGLRLPEDGAIDGTAEITEDEAQIEGPACPPRHSPMAFRVRATLCPTTSIRSSVPIRK